MKLSRSVSAWIFFRVLPLCAERILFRSSRMRRISRAWMSMSVAEAEDPDKDITFYINSPGGVVSAGLAIYDTMQYIRCDVATLCMGQAASMGALLLASGAKGKRYALPHARIMIHQPLGGFQGQVTDIDIHAREILRIREDLNRILSTHSGKTLKKIQADTERDNFMSAAQACEYGLIDKMLSNREQAEGARKA